MKAIQRTTDTDTELEQEDDEFKFKKLVSAIKERNVLLIIGKGFEIENSTEENEKLFKQYGLDKNSDLYDLLLAQLRRRYKSKAFDFSELTGDIPSKKDIHHIISKAIQDCDLQSKDAITELRDLIHTGYFRFVFTTSFSPIVEILMKEQWGEDNVRILSIFDKDKQDIKDAKVDLLTPTVYYLFGKACTENFVVTDNDALYALRRWQRDMRDSHIIQATTNKHLLALGCDHDDWLFRFIWYTLKGSSNLSNGCVSKYAQNSNLERYLKCNKILENKDARSFVKAIISELKKNDNNEKLRDVPNSCDVFISYSRKDGDVADALYSELTKTGLTVWYDKYNLGGKGGRFMDEIFKAIDSCKMFVPILTPTIHEQRRDEDGHPYRLEWKRALKRVGVHGWNDCIPTFDEKYDLYKAVTDDLVPSEFREFAQIDAFPFNGLTLDFTKLANNIIEQLTR